MALPNIKRMETIACYLHEQVVQHGFKAAIEFLSTNIIPDQMQRLELENNEEKNKFLELLSEICLMKNAFTSYAVTKIAASSGLGTMAFDRRFTTSLSRLGNSSAVRFLQYAINDGKWRFAQRFLEERPWTQAPSVLRALVERASVGTSAFRVAQILLYNGRFKKTAMKNNVVLLIQHAHKRLFEYMVTKIRVSLSEVTGSYRSSLENSINTDNNSRIWYSVLSVILRSMEGLDQERVVALNDILQMALKTGVSTFHADLTRLHGVEQMESPLAHAVLMGRLDIVQLLYKTGATTNAELQDAKELIKYGIDDNPVEDVDTTTAIYSYLCNAVSHPRRLQDLCSLSVSHSLGCQDINFRHKALVRRLAQHQQLVPAVEGADNNENTVALKRRVLFLDAVEGFLTGAGCQAEDREQTKKWMDEDCESDTESSD